MKRHVAVFGLGLLVLGAFFTGCSKDEPAPVAGSADEAVRLVTDGLADGRPEVVWHALPASYQGDITELVHGFAGKMDAELWNRTFEVVEKATQVLDEKRDFILDHPMLASQMDDRDEAEEAWDAVVDILEIVVESDLSDLDRMKKLDVERFLSKTGGDLFDGFEALAAISPTGSMPGLNLADAEATLLSSDGDSARVRVEIPGQPTEEMDFTRVEGKWIPAEMAAEWDDTMAEARLELAKLSGEEMAKNKAATMMQLTMVEGALDQLLATKNEQEFNNAIGGLMGMAMGAMMSRANSSDGGLFSSSTPSFSTPQSGPAPITQTGPQQRTITTTRPLTGTIQDFIGNKVRVTDRDGKETQGYLMEVTARSLVIEKRVTGGSVTFEMARRNVESVEPI